MLLGAERLFWQLPGVYTTAVGYSGGTTPNPSYEETCSGRTGHTEAVLVAYDPARISYDELLKTFWEGHDPTQGMRQGNDVGSQYRSALYWTTPAQQEAALASKARYAMALAQSGYPMITTELAEAGEFYYARPTTSSISRGTRAATAGSVAPASRARSARASRTDVSGAAAAGAPAAAPGALTVRAKTGAELVDAGDPRVGESQDVVLLENPLSCLGMHEMHSRSQVRHSHDVVRIGLEDVDRLEHVEKLAQPRHGVGGAVDLRKAAWAEIAEAEVVGQHRGDAVVVACDERVQIPAGEFRAAPHTAASGYGLYCWSSERTVSPSIVIQTPRCRAARTARGHSRRATILADSAAVTVVAPS